MASALPTELQMKMAELENALLQRSPQLPAILQHIHSTLKNQPENVTLMSEDDINKIVEGLKLQTQTHFVVSSSKSKSTGAVANIKKNAADALGF